jgi:hypothetical protein
VNRTATFTNKDNNDIDTMTDYNGETRYAYDDWELPFWHLDRFSVQNPKTDQ